MPDLIDKYFTTDLNEAEDESLSNWLWSNDAAAERFVEASRQAYLDCGLPEPDWEGPLSKFDPPRGGGIPWWGLTFLVLGLSAVLLITGPIGKGLWGQDPTSVPSDQGPSALEGRPAAANLVSREARPRTQEKDPQRVQVDRSIPEEGDLEGSGISGEKPAGRASSLVSHPKAPERKDPAKSYSGLSVEVDLPRTADLAVVVLDPTGTQVGSIYRGQLDPGDWVFEWDGKLSSGQAAQPGYYRIEVRSGSYSQKKTVQIR